MSGGSLLAVGMMVGLLVGVSVGMMVGVISGAGKTVAESRRLEVRGR